MTAPATLVVGIARLLEGLGIHYHVGGSIASSWYGVPRTTADVDIVIALEPDRLADLASALEADFYVSRSVMQEAIERRGSFNAISLRDPLKVDFFVLGGREFDHEEFRRAMLVRLPGESPGEFRIKSPEDLILRKLEWFRSGGEVSERRWRDVVGLLEVQQSHLDLNHLDRWASRPGLDELLARAREAAEAA